MATLKPRSLAVTSGKGGVGKSCIALNLSVAMARLGQRVLLIDADLGLGNIGILMGLSPDYTVEDVLQGRCSPEQAVVEGPEGIAVLAAASDREARFWEIGELTERGELAEFEAGFDFVIVDTGAGIAAKVVDFVAAADEALILVTPEPTSIADSYATLKVLLHKRPELHLKLLVNMAESAVEAGDLQEKFQEIVQRFLEAEIDNRGYIPLDRYVREAVKRQIPFVLADPPSPAAEALVQLANHFLESRSGGLVQGGGILSQALRQRIAADPPGSIRI